MSTIFTPTPIMETLPSMIGFDSEQLGFPECEWTSPCYLLADRDLVQAEVISVWAVDKIDGRVLKVVELKASETTCKRDQWPAALVNAIRDDDTLVDGSKLLHAGRINGDAFDTNTSTPSTSDFISASSHVDCNRLWVFSSRARLFTNAPIISNQVIANNLADVEFATAQHLCMQVRDSTSQHLHESIMVSVAEAKHAKARAETLCKGVAEQSRMVRVGVLDKDGIRVTLQSQGNALWIPQYSGLSVTVESVNWLTHGDFKASSALTANKNLRICVHDDVTGIPLEGSPFDFTPTDEALEVTKWPMALAAALKASPLGDYISLKLDSGVAPVTGKWQRAGIPLRIWMSEPLQASDQWVPMLPVPGQPSQALTVNEWLAGHDPHNPETHVSVIELLDRRTGHVCYRCKVDPTKTVLLHGKWSLMKDTRKWGTVTLSAEEFGSSLCAQINEKLTCALRADGEQLQETKNDQGQAAYTLWLPAELDILATLHWESKIESIELPELDERMFSNMFALPRPWLPYVCTGDTLTTPPHGGVGMQLRLQAESIKLGVRILPSRDGRRTAEILLPNTSASITPSVTVGFITRLCPWQAPICLKIAKTASREDMERWLWPYDDERDYSNVSYELSTKMLSGRALAYLSFKTYQANPIASFNPETTLCADRCMTLGAHVYDTGGEQENGVDHNTGLFHAHYPLATLRGLGGKGPELNVTLHYSAIRANEGALGDGWAFRFSSFDNRRRVLTLSTGQTMTLTEVEMANLRKNKAGFLDKEGFRITGAEGSKDSLTTLIIQTPAGEGGREEVLTLPATHDNREAGDTFKNQYKQKLNTVIKHLTTLIEKAAATNDQIDDYKKQRANWQTELSEIDRKALVLVTSAIRSPQGGELSLAWQGINGHIRLLSITDKPTRTLLLQSTHDTPATQGSCHSTFTVWPTTTESYQVTLEIQNCLLTSLKRHTPETGNAPARHVRFDYEADFALDRVLTSITEEDGSTEVVSYRGAGPDNAPRVDLHTLIPGTGQPCITHVYDWEGDYRISQVRRLQHSSLGYFGMPCLQTNWTFRDGVRLVSTVYESSPDTSSSTVCLEYPETVNDSAWKSLALSRPSKIETTKGNIFSDGVVYKTLTSTLDRLKERRINHTSVEDDLRKEINRALNIELLEFARLDGHDKGLEKLRENREYYSQLEELEVLEVLEGLEGPEELEEFGRYKPDSYVLVAPIPSYEGFKAFEIFTKPSFEKALIEKLIADYTAHKHEGSAS